MFPYRTKEELLPASTRFTDNFLKRVPSPDQPYILEDQTPSLTEQKLMEGLPLPHEENQMEKQLEAVASIWEETYFSKNQKSASSSHELSPTPCGIIRRHIEPSSSTLIQKL